jgi:hypothetical protein
MQRYGRMEEDENNTSDERTKYTYQNEVLLQYEDIMQEMANNIETSK